MMRVFAALMLFAFTAPASADDALSLYQAGKYEPAITAALAQNNAAGFALAARAALGEALTQKPCLSCLQRAESFARKAIAADAHLPDGHVYLAVCLGYEARIIGIIRARLANYPEESKTNLDAALGSDPHNVLALMALGGWNIEIVHSGGAVLANLLYGATVAKGTKLFEAAFKAAPGNIVARYQYALGLGGVDSKTYHGEINDALSRASNGTAMTAYETFIQIRARELLVVFNKGDVAEFDRLVRRDQGNP
jgi:tetratricopeptide (TPR) repeat protein